MTAPSSSDANRATLLYVDDEENDILFMRRAIVRSGIPVNFHTACDGDDALSYLSGTGRHVGRTLPDLILLDLNLPARSGFEVLEWIRQEPGVRSIPVVVLSSSGRGEDRERARLLGANDYVIKPTSPMRLVDITSELWKRWLSPRHAAAGIVAVEAVNESAPSHPGHPDVSPAPVAAATCEPAPSASVASAAAPASAASASASAN